MIEGDCLHELTRLAAASIDAVVCDPPYGIDFQGQRWDGAAIRESAAQHARQRLTHGEAFQTWTRAWANECLRVLKPGGHLLAFGSPRTAHRLACGIEDAGLQLRDTLMWLYGTGMPKSRRMPGGTATALKPAWEPILLARRPPDGTVQDNLARYGTATLNTDACRVDGSFPANLLLDHSPACTDTRCATDCAVATLDTAAERTRTQSGPRRPISRLFYSPKASRRERDTGCEQLPARTLDLFPRAQRSGPAPRPAKNPHPTVKPLAVMRWLVRLATPPGGLVLDPFCGSGTTGAAAILEQRRFVGIERDPAYVQIARARISHSAAPRRDGARPAVPFHPAAKARR